MVSQYLFLNDEKDKAEKMTEGMAATGHPLPCPSSTSGDMFGTLAETEFMERNKELIL